MLDVREEPAVQKAVDDACETWPRALDAWDAIVWTLARDPHGAGTAVAESGEWRLLVFEGVRSLGMPSVSVLYRVAPQRVAVCEVTFFESSHSQAGHA